MTNKELREKVEKIEYNNYLGTGQKVDTILLLIKQSNLELLERVREAAPETIPGPKVEADPEGEKGILTKISFMNAVRNINFDWSYANAVNNTIHDVNIVLDTIKAEIEEQS